MSTHNQVSSSQFEESLEKLQSIVENLEKGEMSLQESLKAFEQGIQLSASCEKTLDAAEQRIEHILSDEPEHSRNQSLDTDRL